LDVLEHYSFQYANTYLLRSSTLYCRSFRRLKEKARKKAKEEAEKAKEEAATNSQQSPKTPVKLTTSMSWAQAKS